MNVINLTKELIKIPSYVGRGNDEKIIGEYIFQYLSTIPWLIVEKQFVTNRRFNIIAKDYAKTKTLICDHIDTVQPQTGWNSDPYKPQIRNGKLYGLGSSDTKGNIASILTAIKRIGPSKGVMYLFYIDEEYDFWGMKKFIQDFQEKINPNLIASADGGNLEIGNACRGLIEITFTVSGKSGHSAIPESGKNAITGSFLAFYKLQNYLRKESYPNLGKNSFNLAWITGGQTIEGNKYLSKEGNIIPNYCRFVMEVRTANSDLRAENIVKLFSKYLLKTGLKLVKYSIRHDLGAWITDKNNLMNLPLKNKVFTKADKRGYVDLQMLWQAFGKPTCFTFGAGDSSTAHQANEYITIDKLKQSEIFWTKYIGQFAQKE